jgi:hypothetical protein
MMAKKSRQPSWFKLWLHHRPLFDALPDDVAGRVIKAALHYFSTGEVVPMGSLEMVAFSSIKADVDEAHADYLRDVENGRRGGRPRQTEEKPPVTEGRRPRPPVTEREGDGDGEGDTEEKGNRDKPPTRHRFTPPTVGEVKQYCRDNGYRLDPERFVDHYESNGWMVGRNKMKDWKAAVRSWSRKERITHGETGSGQVWPEIGTTV